MVEPNWVDKTIWTQDNLPVMRGMNSKSVDLIYLDPPFNSNADYAAPIGSKAAGAAFKDTWSLQDIDIAWLDLIETKHREIARVIAAVMSKSNMSYLIYMSVRLLEMKRILKPTGSVYLHCDPTMNHSLKLLMDAIFGANNFRNDIIWQRRYGRAKGSQHLPKTWGTHNDNLLFYAGGTSVRVRPFRQISLDEAKQRFPKTDEQGRLYTTIAHFSGRAMGDRPNLCYTWRGFTNPHLSGWRVSKERIEQEYQDGKVIIKADGRLERRRYFDPEVGVRTGNLWTDIAPPSGDELTDYPTQKPLALLDRIIRASSNEGDMVLDPFCGCATSMVAADRLARRWVGIDISPKAVELVVERVKADQGMFKKIVPRTDIPLRTDLGPIAIYNSLANKRRLYGEQEGHCNGCGEHFPMKILEVDHIIAENHGGTHHLQNLQLLCANCNRIKGDRGQEYLIARLEQRSTKHFWKK